MSKNFNLNDIYVKLIMQRIIAVSSEVIKFKVSICKIITWTLHGGEVRETIVNEGSDDYK